MLFSRAPSNVLEKVRNLNSPVARAASGMSWQAPRCVTTRPFHAARTEGSACDRLSDLFASRTVASSRC